ncbi:hypothetical protein Enr13x_39350 [Stieleria neptunia]|uniref:Uncharacterized protein n=1 Tax=Stieleria neptunia TaxID=2527979 RepID=A0A518HTC7_9BACT|nr:hypothetical protein [Stieleria neptunia]QDV44074.1 hypothetical protein Enr13x_39350 [Stieleria neptunia]
MNSQFSTGFVIALVIGIAVGAFWPKYGPDLTNSASDRVSNAHQVSFAAGPGRHDGRGRNGGCEQAAKGVGGQAFAAHGARHGQSACGGKGQSAGHCNGQSGGHGKDASAGRGKGQGHGEQTARRQPCSQSGCDHPAEASTSAPRNSEHAQGKHDRANDQSLANHGGPGLGLGLGMGRGWARGFEHAEAESADDNLEASGTN